MNMNMCVMCVHCIRVTCHFGRVMRGPSPCVRVCVHACVRACVHARMKAIICKKNDCINSESISTSTVDTYDQIIVREQAFKHQSC